MPVNSTKSDAELFRTVTWVVGVLGDPQRLSRMSLQMRGQELRDKRSDLVLLEQKAIVAVQRSHGCQRSIWQKLGKTCLIRKGVECI